MLLSNPVFWQSIVLVIALIGATHYFVTRHSLWLGVGEREQKIVGRYICGTLSTGIPLSFLCWEFQQWWALACYWLFVVIAGCVTVCVYRADQALDDAKKAKAEKRDRVTMETLGIGDGKQ